MECTRPGSAGIFTQPLFPASSL